MSTPLVDEATFEQLKELMGDGLGHLVTRYTELSAQYIETIQSALQDDNAEQAKDAAHPLKSSSQQLGVFQVYELAKTIEHEAHEKGVVTDSMKQAAEQLPAVFEQSANALKQAVAV